MINPFYNLYITEKISPEEYVGVVSPLLVPHATKIFSSSNVAVLGTQGSGKTTLLSLLKHEIREAYIKSPEHEFPVDDALSNFISPGINIIKSGILDIGKRPIFDSIESEENIFPLYFADFFNYYICIDLLETLHKIDCSSVKYININTSKDILHEFTDFIKNEDCWFGYLSNVKTYEELVLRLLRRKSIYRNFHQFNIHEMPKEIDSSKTSIGEPISRVVRALKMFEIIPHDTNIFIRIDQVDSILGHDKARPSLSENYRRMINSALVNRDPNISYKIGSRTYAWKKELRIYNSSEQLEESRSYTLINVDNILKRPENAPSPIFPKFAKDVFARRLKHYKLTKITSRTDVFKRIFGRSLKSEEVAQKLCANSSSTKALKIPKDFPEALKCFLDKIYTQSPLEGILALAWLLQGSPQPHFVSYDTSAYDRGKAPWDSKWWRKERIRLALMQLASNCNQLPIWGGPSEIIELGKGGIICFLGICQQIWDFYLRTLPPESTGKKDITIFSEGIPLSLQTLGITSASRQWVEKISELPNGYKNKVFVENMGRLLRNSLLQDQKMSYPGHTGFSLRNSDIQKQGEAVIFLQEAADYGVLFEYDHTSKEKSKSPRTKWYFNPIYYPHLKMYEARIKEPYYSKTDLILEILNETNIERIEKSQKKRHPSVNQQLSLF